MTAIETLWQQLDREVETYEKTRLEIQGTADTFISKTEQLARVNGILAGLEIARGHCRTLAAVQ